MNDANMDWKKINAIEQLTYNHGELINNCFVVSQGMVECYKGNTII